MRLVLVLLLSILAFSQANELSEKAEQYIKGNGNIDLVLKTSVNGLSLIVDELLSFEYNMFKAQYTSFSGEVPAFDIVMDFNKGKMYEYFNLTGNCSVYNIEKLNFTQYMIDLIKDHTEYAGHRGEHLDIYEVKHPEEPGSRTWIYGMWFKKNDEAHAQFIPTMFQAHHPGAGHDEAGEFVDTVGHPKVTPADFSYPACVGVEPVPITVPFTLSPVGLSSEIITRNLFKSY